MRDIGPKDKDGGSNMFIIIGMWPVVERPGGDVCCVLRSYQVIACCAEVVVSAAG